MWCSEKYLQHVFMTKGMVIDFWRKKIPTPPLFAFGSEVEIVDTFKFLGIHISRAFWGERISHLRNKAQQQLFFLRRQKCFGLDTVVLFRFNRAVIECVHTHPLRSVTALPLRRIGALWKK